MEYPKDFPLESRAAVAAEKLRAGKDFDQVRDHRVYAYGAELEEELRKYILRQFLVFVREASKLGNSGIWHVDRMEGAALEFLRLATIDAVYERGQGLGNNWISNWTGHVTSEIAQQFEKSSEWRQYQDALLQVAEWQVAQAVKPKAVTEPGQRRGYRAEVRQWMKRENVRTLDEAAKRLGVDVSALKSIMSARGKRRCSEETQNRILERIGYIGP